MDEHEMRDVYEASERLGEIQKETLETESAQVEHHPSVVSSASGAKVLNNLNKAANTIREWLKNDVRNKSFEIELPQYVLNKVRAEMGRDFDTHIITSNSLLHILKEHGVNGTKTDETKIPITSKDLELIPYIMTAPDKIQRGSMDNIGRESVRFYKTLSNGYVVVVEKEQKSSPNDMETITMWAELSSSNVPDARTNVRPLNSTSQPAITAHGGKTPDKTTARTVIISSDDTAKIRKDAEKAIAQDNLMQFMTVFHGSGAKFDRFDHSYMGTGEGAQAYGWGTYVTEVNGIARSYAENSAINDGIVRELQDTAHEIRIQQERVNGIPTENKKREERIVAKELELLGILNEQKSLKEKYGEQSAEFKDFMLHKEDEISNLERDIQYLQSTIVLEDHSLENRKAALIKLQAKEKELKEQLSKNRNIYTVEIPDNNGENYLSWWKQYDREEIDKICARLKQVISISNYDQFVNEVNNTFEQLGHIIGAWLYLGALRIFSLGSDELASEAEQVSIDDFVKMPIKDLVEGKKLSRSMDIEEDLPYKNGVKNFEEMDDIKAINDTFNEQLQQQIDGTLPKGHVYQLGMPSAELQSTGIPMLPIMLQSSVLNAKSNDIAHSYHLEEIRDLVRLIQKPIAIFEYGDKTKAQNLMIGISQMNDEGKQFLVGLSLNPNIKGKALQINSIRNVFPKNYHDWIHWINQGRLLRADGKAEIQAIINALRINPVDYINMNDLDSATKIVNDFKNPKLKEDDNSRYHLGSNSQSNIATIEQDAQQAQALVDKLKLSNVVINIEQGEQQDMKASAKGYYDVPTGKIVVNAYNHSDAEDVQKTILHEAVAHCGLRAICGNHFDELCTRVYNEAMTAKDRANQVSYAWSTMSIAKRASIVGYQRAARPFAQLSLIEKAYVMANADVQRIAADEFMASVAEVGKDATLLEKIVSFLMGIELSFPHTYSSTISAIFARLC